MYISVFCEKTVPTKKVISRHIEFVCNKDEFFKVRVASSAFIVSIGSQTDRE